MDVTRKVINLARECGNKIELSAVATESLVPEPLRASPSPQEFMEGLHEVRCAALCALCRAVLLCTTAAPGIHGGAARGAGVLRALLRAATAGCCCCCCCHELTFC